MKRIIIIGGGITGLAATHRLLERGSEIVEPFEVTLLEASARPGGTIYTEMRDGFVVERGPDSFISEKPEALDLTRRLGIEDQLIETNSKLRRSFIIRKGRLQPVPEGFHLLAPARLWPFIYSRISSLRGKARIAAELFIPRRIPNGKNDESLAQFVRRRFGDEALVRIAQPMVSGIYTADPEKLSLRATFPRFLEMEAKHRSVILALLKAGKTSGTSGARYSLFLSFQLGMQTLVDALVKAISNFGLPLDPDKKASIRLNARVKSLWRVEDRGHSRWQADIEGGEKLIGDAVLFTGSTRAAAGALSQLDSRLASELAAIRYASTATINLAFRRQDIAHPLNGFGFVVPFVEQRSVLACTFSSVKFAGRAPAGFVLLRAFIGGVLHPQVFAQDEPKIVAAVLKDLRDLLGVNGAPIFAEVSKWPDSMPQYEMGHLTRVATIRQELHTLPGLWLAGNAYGGPGIPDCIRSGESAAEEILQFLK